MPMLISVIIPSYKPGQYLNECLLSIRNQTLSENEYEIIVVLNGCSEPYLQDIEQIKRDIFGDSDQFIIIQTNASGVSNARNLGIEAANGEYLTFVDDDDVVSPTYLASLLEVSTPTCVGCANSYAFDNNLDEYVDNFISKAFRKCAKKKYSVLEYRSFLSPPWCKLIHREIIDNVRFSTKLKKGEDGLFCFALSPRIKEMRLAKSDAIYYQRKRPGSAMRIKRPIFKEFFDALKQEYILLLIWIKHPLSFNFFYTQTRAIGIFYNFYKYIR